MMSRAASRDCTSSIAVASETRIRIYHKIRDMKKSGKAKKAIPKIVSQRAWQKAHEKLLAKEKAVTRQRDKLAAERRRQPMTEIDTKYEFDGPDGKVGLLDLFEGRRQLIVYHFMFAPGVEGWPEAG